MSTIFDLAPTPKDLKITGGEFNTRGSKYIKLQAMDVLEIVPAAEQTLLDWEITASPSVPEESLGLTISLDETADIKPQGYELEIRPDGIEITAADAEGAFYGACTLAQIRRLTGDKVPCLSIKDWPDYPVRGIMLDISRDRVPTMDTLFHLVDLFADWKINQFQLYMEHTFKYLAHPTVWKNSSPITGEEILALDEYCRSKFIELVPNQNSLGHMERWFRHDEYLSLSETPNGYQSKWGWYKYNSLAVADERTMPFITGLYDELLPHFTSDWLNIGLDETDDIGVDRSKEAAEKIGGPNKLYLKYLLDLYNVAKERGRRIMFWGDIVVEHPELIPELPKDAIALEWGYEFNHPWADRVSKFAASGIPFFICPGTMTWNTLCGKADNALENISNGARVGLEFGASGMLNTDWGDNGHSQSIVASYQGFMTGAMASWNAAADVKDRFAEKLSIHAFGDPTGQTGKVFLDLGNIYKSFDRYEFNQTTPWLMLYAKDGDPKVMEGLKASEFDEMERRINAITDEAQNMQPDDSIVNEEFDCIIQMLKLSLDAGRIRLGNQRPSDFDARIAEMKESYKKIWLMRSRPGGLTESVSKFTVK
jgi:hypothetical protein